MQVYEDDNVEVGSKQTYFMLLICSSISYTTTIIHPLVALSGGAAGFIIGITVVMILLGIPLLYMELVVSQFTSRDCLAMWRARPIMAHVGYVMVGFQILNLVYNHIATTFMVHYLLISFEEPKPYYTCGRWSNEDCDMMHNNFTVNEDCLKTDFPEKYCSRLYTTYTEYQYWRFQVLGKKTSREFYVCWKLCLSSFILCGVVYFNCFKRIRSLAHFVSIYAIYPYVVYLIIVLGSMLQKGIVQKYDEALDSSFELFSSHMKIPFIIQFTMYPLRLGQGVMSNLASSASFRWPAHAHAVITGVAAAIFSALCICTSAMIACPLTFKYGFSMRTIMTDNLMFIYEKIPMLMFEYSSRTFYLILMFSCQTVIGIGTVAILFFSLSEMIYKRHKTFAAYPGLFSLTGVMLLFLLTIPMMGPYGVYIVAYAFRGYTFMLSTFILILEIVVFTIWYGFDKFAEDVHFMHGVKPSVYLKLVWIFSFIILSTVFYFQLIWAYNKYGLADPEGFLVLIGCIFVIVTIFLARMGMAACWKQLRGLLELDEDFGPRPEILRRSRAMFTAQAMTKEYMYRQYHLQAGVVARQRRSNVRSFVI